jgi:tRNA threonylcarbamoyl adenosine modification protein YeaZ
MAILGINCATEHLALALLRTDQTSVEKFWQGQTIKAENLLVYLAELLQEAGLNLTQLTKIGIAIGPGAFTGLRLALVTAKTLALELQIPLVPVSTLAALAAQYQYRAGAQNIRVILDACRGDVSTALFDQQLHRLETDHPVKKTELPATENTFTIDNLVPDALTITKLAAASVAPFDREEILKLVPLYSHGSRVNLTVKKELQHLKIAKNNTKALNT